MLLEKCSNTTLSELQNMNLEIQEIIVKKYHKVNFMIPDSLQQELKKFSWDINIILAGRKSPILKELFKNKDYENR